ncbi:MAG: AAA family ATPase, partial [Verrucomicrobia bacterium]|nr:AAA family ATPase [Verrucomicrobiota bacterium]
QDRLAPIGLSQDPNLVFRRIPLAFHLGPFSRPRLTHHLARKSEVTPAALKGLGQINVLCGANNSGKTTVLECIANKTLRFHGKPLNEEAIQRIDEGSMKGMHWNAPHYAKIYRDAIVQSARKSDVWFEDGCKELLSSIEHISRSAGLGGLNTQDEFSRAYLSEVSLSPSVVLIPAKRRLDSSVTVESSQEVKPDGFGVLNFLFFAKNQDGVSPARQSFDKISDGFKSITSGYDFDVFLQSGNKIELRFRCREAKWFQADDCGLGLRDLLIMLYFAVAPEHEVVLIEEPENHLHPEFQHRLIKFLRDTSNKQFFITTHSNVFLSTHFADQVFMCRLSDSVQVENTTSRAAMLTELGYSISDNLVSDLVVLCEGPTDKLVLEEFFQKKGFTEKFSIKVWPLGGDIMDQLDLSVFGISYQVIALIDGDPGSSKIRRRFIEKCNELKLPVHQLRRYALENYLSIRAIGAVMGAQMPPNITELHPNKRVSDQLGFEVKKNGLRIAKEMTLEDIKGTDFEEFLVQVEKMASQGRVSS